MFTCAHSCCIHPLIATHTPSHSPVLAGDAAVDNLLDVAEVVVFVGKVRGGRGRDQDEGEDKLGARCVKG